MLGFSTVYGLFCVCLIVLAPLFFFSTNKEPVFKSSYFFSSDPIADFDFFLF